MAAVLAAAPARSSPTWTRSSTTRSPTNRPPPRRRSRDVGSLNLSASEERGGPPAAARGGCHHRRRPRGRRRGDVRGRAMPRHRARPGAAPGRDRLPAGLGDAPTGLAAPTPCRTWTRRGGPGRSTAGHGAVSPGRRACTLRGAGRNRPVTVEARRRAWPSWWQAGARWLWIDRAWWPAWRRRSTGWRGSPSCARRAAGPRDAGRHEVASAVPPRRGDRPRLA
jgi:hypothetical protein